MSDLSPLRTGRITGSRIAAVLGLSSYAKRADVLREMVRQYHGLPEEFTGNEATEHGQLHEPDAIAAYEAERMAIVYGGQELVIHPLYDFLAITPDGLVGADGMVEVKCPIRARYTHISDKPDYEAQIRAQLECTGRKWCDFVVWRHKRPISVSRIEWDPNWFPSVLPRLLSFMADYHLAIEDPVLLAREKGRGVATEIAKPAQFLADRARWRELEEQEKAIGEELAEVKARVGDQLGDDEIGTIDGQPAAKWQYRNSPSIFDRASFKKEHAALEAQYSSTGKTTRFPILIDSEGDQP